MKMCKLIRAAIIVVFIFLAGIFCGCGRKGSVDVSNGTSMKNKSIEHVLKENTNQWMSIPGVEGVAIGEHKGTSCIRVFTSVNPKNLQDKIPSIMDGFPVIIEKTGPFGALEEKN